MYYEVATPTPNARGVIRHETELKPAAPGAEMYVSMFGFDNSIQTWMEFHKTVSGFNGNYSCKYLYFDVDCKDLETAHRQAKDLVTGIYKHLYVKPAEMYISFSGSKGFHIGLHQNLFGGFGFDRDLPLKIKVLAFLVAAAAYQMTAREVESEYNGSSPKSFRGLDFSIYNPNRIFRSANSVNAKTGLYKIPLAGRELFDMNIDQIKHLARTPRTDFRLECPTASLPLVYELQTLWKESLTYVTPEFAKTHAKASEGNAEKQDAALLKDAFFGPVTEGGRNNDLFKQACMLFDLSVLTQSSVLSLIACVNAASHPPLDMGEVETLVNSAYKRTRDHQRPEELVKVTSDLEDLPAWVNEWADHYTAERRPLTFGFPEIDALTEKDYRGQLICFAGGAGSMKSYDLQNILKENILQYDAVCAYASMEMSKIKTAERFLNMIFEAQGEKPSSIFKRIVKQDKQLFFDSISGEMQNFTGRLFLNSKAGLDANDFYKWIKRIKELYGPVDMLGIDGASMMKGASDDEFAAMSRNSAELKDLANQENLCIVTIFHLTKDIQPYHRDVIRKMRGSGKIIDNGDQFFGFSKLIDPSTSTPDQVKYVKGYGHINYWNKRGEGEILDLVFESDPYTACIKPSIRIPEEFMTYEEFCKDYERRQTSGATVFKKK